MVRTANKRCKYFAAIAACLGLAVSLGCSRGESSKPEGPEKSQPQAKAEKKSPEEITPSLSGREILERMVAAYQKANSYSDHGHVRLLAEIGDKPLDIDAPFSLALERPNKLRMEAYLAQIVCNGKELFAAVNGPDFTNQVLLKPAPERITIKTLFMDPELSEAWTQGFGGPMPQTLFLFSNDPMEAFLNGAEKITLQKPGEIDARKYYRVRIEHPEGVATFWIDQETFVLRRVVMPTDLIRQDLSREGPVKSISLVADFVDAQLGGRVDPEAFHFAVPPGAEKVKFFVPPPLNMLGKKAPALTFFDLDGKPVTLESLAGKVVVLDFWATWCGPCRDSLPTMEKIFQRFKDNPKVAFYDVSVDRPETDNKELVNLFKELKVNIPILRDTKQSAGALPFSGIPALFVIGGDGVVQFCAVGTTPKLFEELPAKIDALLAGENVYQQTLREFEEEMEKVTKKIAEQFSPEGGTPADKGRVEEHRLPEVKTAPRTGPARLKLRSLWKCDQVTMPGNVLVVRDGKGPARLLVIENWNSVAELVQRFINSSVMRPAAGRCRSSGMGVPSGHCSIRGMPKVDG